MTKLKTKKEFIKLWESYIDEVKSLGATAKDLAEYNEVKAYVEQGKKLVRKIAENMEDEVVNDEQKSVKDVWEAIYSLFYYNRHVLKYQCKVCRKLYAQEGNIYKHIQNDHHEEVKKAR